MTQTKLPNSPREYVVLDPEVVECVGFRLWQMERSAAFDLSDLTKSNPNWRQGRAAWLANARRLLYLMTADSLTVRHDGEIELGDFQRTILQ